MNSTPFLSATLGALYQDFETRRPTVVGIKPFKNNNQKVASKTNQITIGFSEPMDQTFRNFDYGPLGEDASIRIKNGIGYAADGQSLTFEIEDLKPNKQYQLTIGSGFRNANNVPLKAYLIDFKTKAE